VTPPRVIMLCALAALPGCKRGSGSRASPSPSVAGPVLPEVRVTLDGGPFLFSYYGEDGKLHDAPSIERIPAGARRQVLVRDLGRTPAELQTDRYLYLADLRGPIGEEGLATSVVSRYQFEAQDDPHMPLPGEPSEETASDGGRELRVIVYGTSWCGACKAARDFLRGHHIPFIEKDIEKDQAAENELARKAKRAGLKLGGVPVLDVAGQLVMGYDPGTLSRLWAKAQR
jgi:glutaredoxin